MRANRQSRTPPPPSGDARATILDAAAALWKETGGAGFGMDLLAERAGVSRMTLYRHFAGKRALLDALARERGVAGAGEPEPDARERILAATRRLFLEVGVHQATIERIAEAAGVGPATVYRQFGSREGLLAAFAEANPARTAARALPAAATDDYEEQLVRLAERILTSARDQAPVLLAILADRQRSAELFRSVEENPGRTHRLLGRYLAALMRKGRLREMEPARAAAALVGQIMFFGVLGPAVGMLPEADPPRDARFLVSLFLDGMRPRPSRSRR